MANAGPASVRSHRRGQEPLWRSPVLMGVVVVALLAGVGAVAWDFATHRGCTGRLNAIIAASPDITPILDRLNTEWAETHPQSSSGSERSHRLAQLS